MKLLSVHDDDFQNYKKVSMFICTPRCNGKCFKEMGLGCETCQNWSLNQEPMLEIDNQKLLKRYLNNPYSSAIVIGGMEPLLDTEDIIRFIMDARKMTQDTIVVYTGYYPPECEDFIKTVENVGNLVIKFGRYNPTLPSVYSDVLGVTLASSNQYALEYK